jgi:hypothetical protein
MSDEEYKRRQLAKRGTQRKVKEEPSLLKTIGNAIRSVLTPSLDSTDSLDLSETKTKAEATKAKAEATKAEATKAEATKAEATKAEATKAEATKAEATKAEATKAEATKAKAKPIQLQKIPLPENKYESPSDVSRGNTIDKELQRLELINADEYKPIVRGSLESPEDKSLKQDVLQDELEDESLEDESPQESSDEPSEDVLQDELEEESQEELSKESLEDELSEDESPSEDSLEDESPPAERPLENSPFLYPSLNDPFLNQKIAKRNEFSAFTYDADITQPLKETSDMICENPEFELQARQLFVKTFISQNTPYKGLLIYHGVGTGKTCSAIGIAEELRDYMKNAGITQRIMVIASSNVQNNFRLQLFDETKLKQVEGVWKNNSCVGNKLIREINPVGANISREKIVSQVKTIINTSYAFMGYLQLANFIQENVYNAVYEATEDAALREQIEVQNIQRIFNNRLIIIDEVHNCAKEDKRLAKLLLRVAAHADNLRLILMSATPMFNSPREIIWICNLLNINDRRAPIQYEDAFTAEGVLVKPDLLQQKLNGYVSYVRGENPYTFPFRIYPDAFAPDNAQLAKTPMITPLYYTTLDPYQQESYELVMREYMNQPVNIDFNNESYGYAQLQMPLQALNMTFHRVSGDAKFVGKEGLQTNMSFVEKSEKRGDVYEYRKYNYEYKRGIPRIFHETELRKYSSKIADICACVRRSRGIIIIYTQYIDGGIVPVSLALEEMGFTRYGTSANATQLFKPGAIDSEPIDAITMKPAVPGTKFSPAKYMILSGDKYFSQNNAADINYATGEANKNGALVRVILISRAASEGLDFKYVRQVHILDPWYNLNRIEQIVGRGVRNLSHCKLEFEERNVEIYLHAALPDNVFSADTYVYQYAEKKAQNIGKVTRLLKQISVDCVLNHSQTYFTDVNMTAVGKVMIRSSTMEEPQLFQVGDKSNSSACDYMPDCEYSCLPEEPMPEEKQGILITKPSAFILQKLIEKVTAIIGREIALHYDVIENMVGVANKYNLYFALTELVQNPSRTFTDKYGRVGRLINRDKYYLFQPVEVSDPHSSVFDSMVPVQVKNERVRVGISSAISEQTVATTTGQAKATPTIGNVEVRRILAEIEMNVARALGPATVTEANDEDWYNHMNSYKASSSKKKVAEFIDYTAKKQLMEKHGITEAELTPYIWEHALNSLEYKDRVTLAKWAVTENIPTTVLERYVVEYFKYLVFQIEDTRGILIAKDDENVLFDLTDWSDITYRMETFDPVLNERLFAEPLSLPKIVGFFGGFKTGISVFKIKQFLLKRNNPGAYLMQEAKGDIIVLLNNVLKSANVPIQYEADTTTKMSKIALGIILEVVMRKIASRKKPWYMRQEMANYNKIQRLKI